MFQILREEKYRRWIVGVGLNAVYIHEDAPFEVEEEIRKRGVNVIRIGVLRVTHDSG